VVIASRVQGFGQKRRRRIARRVSSRRKIVTNSCARLSLGSIVVDRLKAESKREKLGSDPFWLSDSSAEKREDFGLHLFSLHRDFAEPAGAILFFRFR